MSWFKPLLAAAFGSLMIAVPGVNAAVTIPLVNGSFEDVDQKRRWDVHSEIHGWFTLSGTGIEIQSDGVARTQTPFGKRWVELDSHNKGRTSDSFTNSAMGQVVSLDPGDYSLTFHYKPRTNKERNDNGILSSIFGWDATNGVPLGTALAELHIIDQTRRNHGGWAEYNLAFTTPALGDYLIRFEATGRQNSLGGFIDNVALARTVPEPSTWLMMLAGFALVGTVLARRANQVSQS